MKKATYLVALFFILIASSASAAMQSSNFHIYDSLNNDESSYAGPTIFGVGATAGFDTAVVSWQTSELADSYVIFSTDPALADGTEHGSALKSSMSHSVSLAGLQPSTLYYFKVRSTGLYGSASYSGISSFTTTARTGAGSTVISGNGILYLERRDTFMPAFTKPAMVEVNSDSAIVYWQSDEPTNSFVEYTSGSKQSQANGDWEFVSDHYLKLNNLEPETSYTYRVLGADPGGNLASSSFATFVTLKGGERGTPANLPQKPADSEIRPGGGQGTVINDLPTSMGRTLAALTNYNIGRRAAEFEQTVNDFLQALKNLSSNVPRASLIGAPKVTIDGGQAVITWQTDRPVGTQVAFVSEGQYKPQAAEPYYSFQGDNDTLVTKHAITVYGLEADTIYHYQIRSRSGLGITTKSEDYVFRTPPAAPTILSYNFEIVGPDRVIFRWVTSQETDTAVRTTPVNGLVPVYTKAVSYYDKKSTIIHQVEIGKLDSSTVYEIELSGKTRNNEVVSRKISNFLTTKDSTAPKVSQIKSEVTLIEGKQVAAQAIISWQTDEPASSKVYYILGAKNFTVEEAQLIEDSGYNVRHVAVINKLQPGQVYSYRVASADSFGNAVLSDAHTVYIPRKLESLFDLIAKYFKQIFGWIGNIR